MSRRFYPPWGFRLEHEIKLRHKKQRYNWDCGLACICMVLDDAKRKEFVSSAAKICKEDGFGKSTWTIDLCYILKRFGVKHEFCTLTLGVRNSYKQSTFYEKIFTKDEERVNRKFKEAVQLGWRIKKSAVSLDDILTHLSQGPIIVLTNSRLLSCEICKHNKVSTELRKCIPMFVPYQGHYIVLCGYNVNKRTVYYRNPTFNDHVCGIKFNCFEEARKSYGTDEDIIFIYM